MTKLWVRTPAKVNLFLRVLGRRPDGYHDLETIFQTVDLWDDLLLETSSGDSSLAVPGHPELETRSNLVMRAVRLLEQRVGKPLSTRITLNKGIPVAGGLGGGSSDAAAVLQALCRLYDLELSHGDLAACAVKLGADAPFFLTGGTAVGEGIGERLTPIELDLDYRLVLVNPGFPVSTASVFSALSPGLTDEARDPTVWRRLRGETRPAMLLVNDLQEVTRRMYPDVGRALELLSACGFKHVLMSGSGPTVFALAEPGDPIPDRMPGIPDTWMSVAVTPVNSGPIID